MVLGEAASLLVVLGGIQSQGATTPHLGVVVFQDQLALDYRIGNSWTFTVLDAFFRLLLDLSALDEKPSLSIEDGIAAKVESRFQQT